MNKKSYNNLIRRKAQIHNPQIDEDISGDKTTDEMAEKLRDEIEQLIYDFMDRVGIDADDDNALRVEYLALENMLGALGDYAGDDVIDRYKQEEKQRDDMRQSKSLDYEYEKFGEPAVARRKNSKNQAQSAYNKLIKMERKAQDTSVRYYPEIKEPSAEKKQAAFYEQRNWATDEPEKMRPMGLDAIDQTLTHLMQKVLKLKNTVKGKDVYDMSPEKIDSLKEIGKEIEFYTRQLNNDLEGKGIHGGPEEEDVEGFQGYVNRFNRQLRQKHPDMVDKWPEGEEQGEMFPDMMVAGRKERMKKLAQMINN